jgi:hypothetical protein
LEFSFLNISDPKDATIPKNRRFVRHQAKLSQGKQRARNKARMSSELPRDILPRDARMNSSSNACKPSDALDSSLSIMQQPSSRETNWTVPEDVGKLHSPLSAEISAEKMTLAHLLSTRRLVPRSEIQT